ncbi:hypothetical protein ASPZODRAFT_1614200 [Penicilliopsis zonata CBS 506.65]|uniref:Uncharacterized protein n=1 Tax=Penicilliopsis zonata CBS 506.65 TaxID=1073090 RepID=A0A1L9SNA0_9EURO|nr:hypothetical protein ASPZODRAFT_1614200 [Penicilliopsis zonata CBS 506.65]OJJ48517.1 hypothetical protein ASPZODRAFT_1614200 [Penicilliopsis zonata CBS 506.65]
MIDPQSIEPHPDRHRLFNDIRLYDHPVAHSDPWRETLKPIHRYQSNRPYLDEAFIICNSPCTQGYPPGQSWCRLTTKSVSESRKQCNWPHAREGLVFFFLFFHVSGNRDPEACCACGARRTPYSIKYSRPRCQFRITGCKQKLRVEFHAPNL